MIDRRTAPRVEGLWLTPGEREMLRECRERSASCGSTWLDLRGQSTKNERVTDHRWLTRCRCGRRGCGPCFKTFAKRAAKRLIGEWKLILTLTLPQKGRDVGNAHRTIAAMMTRYCARLRGLVRRKSSLCELDGKLQYAWVIEPHKSGWPHVHMVLSASWLSIEWARCMWADLCGTRSAWVEIEEVRDQTACRDYLCAYLTKAVWSDDLLAIHYRRRLWASTMPEKEDDGPVWTVADTLPAGEALEVIRHASEWAAREGWVTEWSDPDIGAEWTRTTEPYISPSAWSPYEGRQDHEPGTAQGP